MRNLDGVIPIGVMALTDDSDFFEKDMEQKNYQVFIDEFESMDETTLFEEVKEEQAYEAECDSY